MDGSAANLVTRTDGVSWAYAANSRQGGDSYSGTITNLINGLIDDLNTADAWPPDGYDLYSHVNNEYDAWRNQYFTALDRSPGLQESVWGFEADPDADGLTNGAEAYFGTNPLVPGKSPFVLSKSNGTLTIRWLRSVEERNVRPIIDVSLTMATWLVGSGITIQPRNDLFSPVGYRWEEVVLSNNIHAKRFYRFRFEPR
jgi:hypothetical protein